MIFIFGSSPYWGPKKDSRCQCTPTALISVRRANDNVSFRHRNYSIIGCSFCHDNAPLTFWRRSLEPLTSTPFCCCFCLPCATKGWK
ncbi:hypothetical protein L6164_035590 [Bauhinia variegata]|uniref:Uncharacterized protein n=1 Tax=Bauhinia variegata TaxID=167791 RepID=A0ACB9KEF5_BAUVA|nr:hypothetical protein L6164_035590 [Bauhinia variegata]